MGWYRGDRKLVVVWHRLQFQRMGAELKRLHRERRFPISDKLGGLVAATFVRTWMSTLDYQIASYDPTVDPARDDFRGPVIAVFWHENLLLPFYLQGHSKTVLLTSQHRDAEWLSIAAAYLGYETVRGSTYRGGARAILELVRHFQDYNIGIAADGPRGPRRELAQGAIYLSSKMKIPLVPYGIGYDRPWRMKSWDSFAVPRPYSRGRMITGPRLDIPPKLSRQALAHYQQRVEDLLNCLTREAEAWARAGNQKEHQRHVFRKPAPARLREKGSLSSTTVSTPLGPLPGYVPPPGFAPREIRNDAAA